MPRTTKPESIGVQFNKLPLNIQQDILDEFKMFELVIRKKIKDEYVILNLIRIHKIRMIKYYYGRYCSG